jgi:hypothetical protein
VIVTFAPLLLLAFTFRQGGLDKPVTFTCAATPASVAIHQISEQSATQLTVAAPIADEMLVLRFKDVPLRVAMDKIASAATGEWTRTEAGYQLTRPSSLIRQIEHEQRAKRIALVRKAMAERVKSFGQFNATLVRAYFDALSKLDGGSQDRADGRGDDVQGKNRLPEVTEPNERFATRILSDLSSEELADLSGSERTVFSTSPTPMQRALGASALGHVLEFIQEEKIWEKELPDGMGGGAATTTGGGGAGEQMDERMFMGWAAINKPVQRVLMIVQPDWDYAALSIQFKICDSAGNVMAGSSTSLDLRGDESEPQIPDKKKADDQSPQTKPAPLILSPSAQELNAFLSLRNRPGLVSTRLKFSPELLDLLTHPETHDPLALYPSEPILKVAEAKELNVAMCIDDDYFALAEFPIGSADQLLDTISTWSKPEKGWLVGRPINLLHPRHESRKALGVFLRSCQKAGRIDLESLGGYAQGVPEFESSLGDSMSRVLFPLQRTGGGDWIYVRLFGSLNASQRDVLAHGGKLPLSTMTSNQIATVSKIVYRSEVQVLGANPGPGAQVQDSVPVSATMFLLSEPTQLLPAGIDLGISLSMIQNSDRVIFATASVGSQPISTRILTEQRVASSLLAVEHRGGGTGNSITYGYAMGDRQTFQLTLNLPRRCSDSGTLSDSVMDPGGSGSVDKLPADVLQRINDRLVTMRKAQPVGNAGGSDKRVPPP